MNKILIILLSVIALWGGCARRSLPAGATGSILVTVRDAKGRPLPGATIVIKETTSRGPLPLIAPVTDAAGRFRWPGLPPGRFVLSASAPGYAAGTCAVTVKRGQTAPADLVLRRK